MSKVESVDPGPHLTGMKPTLDQYQTNPSRQPASIQRYVRRGEALGRFLLRLAAYLRRPHRGVHPGAEALSRGQEQRAAMRAASVLDVKRQKDKAARLQEGGAHPANDEHYKSVA